MSERQGRTGRGRRRIGLGIGLVGLPVAATMAMLPGITAAVAAPVAQDDPTVAVTDAVHQPDDDDDTSRAFTTSWAAATAPRLPPRPSGWTTRPGKPKSSEIVRRDDVRPAVTRARSTRTRRRKRERSSAEERCRVHRPIRHPPGSGDPPEKILGDPGLLHEDPAGDRTGRLRTSPPGEYVMADIARLLKAVAFSVHIDGPSDHRVVSSTTEIAHLVLTSLRLTVRVDAQVGQSDPAARPSRLDQLARTEQTQPQETAMSIPDVTVLLVHGAFAESASWNPVISRLRAESGAVVAVANPLRSLSGDAAYLREVITGIGTPVVLVGHSYGGMVITEAAARNDAVLALVYAAAFAPEHGESALQLTNEFPGSTLGQALVTSPVPGGGNEFRIRPEVFHQQFVADGPETEARLMDVTQRPAAEAALTEGLPTDAPAWRNRPSWFVFGDEDLNIPVASLRHMAERAGSKGTREVAGASHAICVGGTDQVTAAVLDAIGATG